MTYITPHKVFAHLGRLDAWRGGGKPAPVTLEWDLCNRCSLGCQSCHFAHTHTRGPWAGRAALPMAFEGTGDLADEALVRRALQEAARAGVGGVVWSGGGEPTLHPAWREIVAYGASLGLRQGMYTLGGHLDAAPETARALAALDWLVVSLDAADPGTYAAEKGVGPERFWAACDGVRLARAAGCVVGASFLLHGGNWRQAWAMLGLARELGATYATFRPTIETLAGLPAVPRGRAWLHDALPREEGSRTALETVAGEPDVECDLDRFRQYRDWAGHGYAACHGIKLNATVTPDGRVWVCPQRRGVPGSCVGDLRIESFGALWARHPGTYTVDGGCRAMCRLHLVNQVLDGVFAARQHEMFV